METSAKIALVFERKEKKYLMGRRQFEELLERLLPYMRQDRYGLHTICNVYYDTPDYELIKTSLEKPVYKEKLRLRSYGVPGKDDLVFLEIKKKYQGVVYKRRTAMTLKEAEAYLENGKKPSGESQILCEIDYFLKHYRPVPAAFLAYDRIALFEVEDKNIRITFDRNIRSRDYDLDLSLGDYGELLLEDDCCLMEIKVPGVFPLWLAHILSEMRLYPVSFSKYGNVYLKEFSQAVCQKIH